MSAAKIALIIRRIPEADKIGSRLVLLTHTKSHTGCRCRPLVLKSVTLNSIMAVIVRYITEYGSFGANFVTVVEVTPILSAAKM